MPSLQHLLREDDFDRINLLLQDSGAEVFRWFEKDYGMLNQSSLQVLLQSNPPSETVALMLKRMRLDGVPTPEVYQDAMGRTPLHHAVGYLCDPNVIRVLLSTQPGIVSACIADCQGRLALHVAVRPFSIWSDQKKEFLQKRLVVSVEDAKDLSLIHI